MTPNKLRTSLLAACAALTIAGGMAHAGADGKDASQRQGHHMHRGGHGPHGGAPLMGTLRQLDLTAEQKQNVRSVFETTKQQRAALRDQQRSNRTALASTLPDNPEYPALIAARKKLAADAIQQSSDTQTQVYALLTAEQKAQIPQLLAERQARREQQRERFKNRAPRATADTAS